MIFEDLINSDCMVQSFVEAKNTEIMNKRGGNHGIQIANDFGVFEGARPLISIRKKLFFAVF